MGLSAALVGARARAGRVARATAFLPGLVAALLGAANLLRWPLGDAWAQGWARGDPCTGAGLVLAGAALAAQALRRPRLVATFGAGAGLVVALSILLLGLGSQAPGLLHRPAPPATVGLLLTLIAVALVHERGGERRLAQGLLGVIVAQLALVALVGFGYDPEVGGAVSGGLALLGVGLITASWAHQVGEPLGRMHARRAALVTASATTLGFCVVWQLLLDRERERTDAGIARAADDVARGVRRDLEERLTSTLERVADRWELRGETPRARWVRDAGEYLEDNPGYQALAVVDARGRPRAWAPDLAGELLPAQAATPAAQAAMLRAARTGLSQVSAGLELAPGVRGLWVVVPANASASRFVVAVLRYDQLLAPHLRPLDLLGLGAAVWTGEALVAGDLSVTGSRPGDATAPARTGRGAARDAVIAGSAWRFEVWPTLEALEADTTILPEVSLLLGLGLSSALAGLVDLMVRERHRHREAAAAAQRLAREAGHRLEAEALLAEQARRLERYAGALARSNQDLEAFAYVAAHDLRSPLRAIRSLSTWIEEDLKEHLVGESKENLALLRARVKRMEDLLQSLLDYSRAGRATGDVAAVDVAALAREAWDLLGAPEGFRLELAPDLPRFQAARAPFEQVVRNLLSNAIKHHDRPTGVVSLSADGPRDGAFAFTVTDDGPGIPPEYHEQVFGMFKTLKPRDKVEGSGMGLALVKRLVERHGGAVRIASPTRADAGGAGRGTTLRFTWPATPRAEEAA